MKKKILSALLAAVLAVSAAAVPTVARAAEPTPAEMKLWYDEPAGTRLYDDRRVWKEQTLPIGNGKLGANVYGGVQYEHLTINEETLWAGGRGSVNGYDGGNPSGSKVDVYNQIAEQCMNGAVLSGNDWPVSQLAGDPASQSGYYDGYQPLGDLYFDFSGHTGYSGYQRSLNLDQGLSTVSYSSGNGSYTREYFVSHPDNVIVSHFEAKDGTLNFTTRFTSKQRSSVETRMNGNIGYITVSGTVNNNDLKHNTQIAVVSDGTVSVSGNNIQVSGATNATVYLTAATDYKNEFSKGTTEYWYRTGEDAAALNARVSQKLNDAVRKGYEQVKKAHTSDYTGLYNRVKLDLGQSNAKCTDDLLYDYQHSGASDAEKRYLEVLLFQYGRYLLISGSRDDSQLPTTLQGIWTERSEAANWYSDIHTNINLQMNYWLSGSCNLTECAMPLVNYMSNLAEPGGRTVKLYTGSDYGIMAHTQNTPYGYTAPGWAISTWGWSPAAATWLMQNCYDYYQYSQDENTLRSTIYPMMKEQVLMYEQLLRETSDGRKVMPIALSPEFNRITAGNTFEQSIIWQLYADTIEAANLLGLDQGSVDQWQATMDKLDPIEIGQSGQIKEWRDETTLGCFDPNLNEPQRKHRHMSNLLGLFPGDLISSQAEIDAAKVSLDYKNFGATNDNINNKPDGGWTYGQMIPSWARVGEGANAYFCVSQMISQRFYSNLWDWHTDSDSGVFQIDGNYGYSAGVAEMLMQSNNGVIRLLPAIDKNWANGSVSGLLAEGNTEVDIIWKNQQVTSATLTPQMDGTMAVENPFGDKLQITNSKGEVIPYEPAADSKAVTFRAINGERYTLTAGNQNPDPEPPVEDLIGEVKAVRNPDGTVTLTWNGKATETYTITRKDIKNP